MIIKNLPYPPTINHYYHRQSNGALYVSAEGKNYKNAVKHNMNKTSPMEGKVKIHIDVFPPDRKRRDLDNINKCLLDSIQHAGMIKDDFDIDHLSMWRREPIKGGKIAIKLQTMDSFLKEISKEKIESWEAFKTTLVNRTMVDLEISTLRCRIKSLESMRSKMDD